MFYLLTQPELVAIANSLVSVSCVSPTMLTSIPHHRLISGAILPDYLTRRLGQVPAQCPLVGCYTWLRLLILTRVSQKFGSPLCSKWLDYNIPCHLRRL